MSKMVSGDISLHPTAPLTRARASIILSPVQWWITSFSPSPMDTSRTSLVNPPDEYCLWWISLLKVKVLVVQSCLTLCNSMDYIPSQSSVHGILQARILEWVAIPFSRGTSQPRDWTHISCTAGRFFTTEPPGKPNSFWNRRKKKRVLLIWRWPFQTRQTYFMCSLL